MGKALDLALYKGFGFNTIHVVTVVNISFDFVCLFVLFIFASFSGLSLNTEDINCMVEALGTGGYQCTECGHFSTVKQNLRKHIDAKHVYKQPIDCQYCEKKCPSKNALMTHISRYHKLR